VCVGGTRSLRRAKKMGGSHMLKKTTEVLLKWVETQKKKNKRKAGQNFTFSLTAKWVHCGCGGGGVISLTRGLLPMINLTETTLGNSTLLKAAGDGGLNGIRGGSTVA